MWRRPPSTSNVEPDCDEEEKLLKEADETLKEHGKEHLECTEKLQKAMDEQAEKACDDCEYTLEYTQKLDDAKDDLDNAKPSCVKAMKACLNCIENSVCVDADANPASFKDLMKVEEDSCDEVIDLAGKVDEYEGKLNYYADKVTMQQTLCNEINAGMADLVGEVAAAKAALESCTTGTPLRRNLRRGN